MYKNHQHTSGEVTRNALLRFSNVTAKSLHRVASNMRKRVNGYIAERGGISKAEYCSAFYNFNVIYFPFPFLHEWR
jgi:hypothetical protein